MRGLIKATAFYNKIEALKDWRRAVELAVAMSRGDLVERHGFDPQAAGWRTIDKRTASLKADLEQAARARNPPAKTL